MAFQVGDVWIQERVLQLPDSSFTQEDLGRTVLPPGWQKLEVSS